MGEIRDRAMYDRREEGWEASRQRYGVLLISNWKSVSLLTVRMLAVKLSQILGRGKMQAFFHSLFFSTWNSLLR
jgi:hypothetical protein